MSSGWMHRVLIRVGSNLNLNSFFCSRVKPALTFNPVQHVRVTFLIMRTWMHCAEKINKGINLNHDIPLYKSKSSSLTRQLKGGGVFYVAHWLKYPPWRPTRNTGKIHVLAFRITFMTKLPLINNNNNSSMFQ